MTWTEQVEQYLREGRTVSGGTSAKSGQQKQAENIANQDFSQQKNLTGTAQSTLGQFEGPVQQSPFYKSLLTTGIESTSQAYDNAAANQRQKANAAGFGYTQPVAQGADNQLRAKEATDLAAVPREAAVATAPLSLEASRQTGSMGMNAGSQGLSALDLAANQQNRRRGWLQNLQAVGQGGGLLGFGGGGGLAGLPSGG